MDHMRVLRRAWHILWSYRALWIFGIILTLTTASGGNGGGRGNIVFSDGNDGRSAQVLPGEVEQWIEKAGERLTRFFDRTFGSGADPQALIGWGVGLACLILLLVAVTVIANVVAQVALFRMVDGYEATGERVKVKQGFRLGWSRRAWRLFLMDLVIKVPLVIAFILVALLSLTPLLAWTAGNTAVSVFATVVAIGLFFVVVCAMVVVGTLVHLLTHFAQRACALDDLGVFASIRRGYTLLRSHVKDVALMWLIMLGAGIGYMIVTIIAGFLLLIVAGVIALLIFLATRGGVALFTEGAVSWVTGGLIAVPVFIALLAVPMTFAAGLYAVFRSTVWSLTYRELTALEIASAKGAAPSGEAGIAEASGMA